MAVSEPAPPPRVVQCGWCPVIMADDMTVILLHFAEDHGIANGDCSIRHNVQGPDWDVSEIAGAEP